MLELYGRRYDTGEPVAVGVRDDRIAWVRPAWPRSDLAAWPYVAPAMFDLQINGHGGVWFSDDALTPEAVLRALEPHYRYGITRLCPTLITNSFDGLAAGFRAIREACEQHEHLGRMVPGCHLEGPYISPVDGPRGAHPAEHVRGADWGEFTRLQQISGNRIRLVTLAPETPGALEFIRKATDAGVLVAIGHTAASPPEIAAAVDAGARLSTHLGNGAHAMLHRHHNYIWAQLSEPRLFASIIADGHHLPPGLVRTIIAVKSPRQTILTCDAAGWAGCPPGVYEHKLGRSEILEDGKLVVAGQRELLAGSAYETDVCVGNAMRFADVTLQQALDMAGRVPARLLGVEEGRLARGGLADLILLQPSAADGRLEVLATVAGGVLRYGTIPSAQEINGVA